jgi:hypothetical protein
MSKLPTSDRKCNVWRRSGAIVEKAECAYERPKFVNKLVLRKRDGED